MSYIGRKGYWVLGNYVPAKAKTKTKGGVDRRCDVNSGRVTSAWDVAGGGIRY